MGNTKKHSLTPGMGKDSLPCDLLTGSTAINRRVPMVCLCGFVQTMQAVNKKMDPQKTLKTMQDFQKENMKMGMTEEMSKNARTHTRPRTHAAFFKNQLRR